MRQIGHEILAPQDEAPFVAVVDPTSKLVGDTGVETASGSTPTDVDQRSTDVLLEPGFPSEIEALLQRRTTAGRPARRSAVPSVLSTCTRASRSINVVREHEQRGGRGPPCPGCHPRSTPSWRGCSTPARARGPAPAVRASVTACSRGLGLARPDDRCNEGGTSSCRSASPSRSWSPASWNCSTACSARTRSRRRTGRSGSSRGPAARAGPPVLQAAGRRVAQAPARIAPLPGDAHRLRRRAVAALGARRNTAAASPAPSA